MILDGTVLRGPAFEPVEGRVVVEDGEVAAVEPVATPGEDIVLPAFVNAHTHLGDAVAAEAGADHPPGDLVDPPGGLRDRLLEAADREAVVDAVRRALRVARASGTTACVDFRAGGVEGVRRFREAAADVDVAGVVLGRGGPAVVETADGYGAPGADAGDLSAERAAATRADKPFGVHAGEADAGDVNAAMDLDPDFLVGLAHADPLHLERLADSETPVVVCPRAALATGDARPPVRALLDRTTVALGTDNAFLNAPSMFREMAVTARLFDLSAPEVLRMATTAAAEVAGLPPRVVEPGRPAELLVLDGAADNLADARDVRRAVVRRATAADVQRVVRPADTA